MLDALFLSGNSMNLTKIFKMIRQFFNLSKIEGGDTFFKFVWAVVLIAIREKN